MKSRNVLIASVVVVLVGAVWFWFSAAPSTDIGSTTVPDVSVVPPRIEAPVVKSPEVASKPPVPSQETIEGLLSNESLAGPELLAGLAKIVLTPARKAEERNEALSHLLNLTDEDNQSVLLKIARDPSLDAPLARRLFEDAFNRSHSWQVDLGLELLGRQDLEPLHTAVREHLVFLVGPDVATNSDLATLKQAGAAAKKRWSEQAAQ